MTLDNLQILQAHDKKEEGSLWLLLHVAHRNIKRKTSPTLHIEAFLVCSLVC